MLPKPVSAPETSVQRCARFSQGLRNANAGPALLAPPPAFTRCWCAVTTQSSAAGTIGNSSAPAAAARSRQVGRATTCAVARTATTASGNGCAYQIPTESTAIPMPPLGVAPSRWRSTTVARISDSANANAKFRNPIATEKLWTSGQAKSSDAHRPRRPRKCSRKIGNASAVTASTTATNRRAATNRSCPPHARNQSVSSAFERQSPLKAYSG